MSIPKPFSVPDLDEVAAQLSKDGAGHVQFDNPFTETLQTFRFQTATEGPDVSRDAYLAQLNDLCKTWGEKLTVRFWGFHGKDFDAAILHEIPDVAALVINSMYDDAQNLAVLGELTKLRHLSMGIFGLTDKQVLSRIPLKGLTSLSLEETNTKALDLAPLADAKNLRSLALYGHKKNIGAISDLTQLERLTFNPTKSVSCDFLNGMRSLQTLNFVLGTGDSLTDLTTLPAIEDLAITMVRGLSDLGNLQRFPTLKRLLIQDQPHLHEITMSADNTALTHLWFNNCPNLTALPGFAALPRAISLRAFKTGLDIEAIDMPPTLTHAAIHSGARRDESAEHAAITARGLIANTHRDMPFSYK